MSTVIVLSLIALFVYGIGGNIGAYSHKWERIGTLSQILSDIILIAAYIIMAGVVFFTFSHLAGSIILAMTLALGITRLTYSVKGHQAAHARERKRFAEREF